MKIRVGLSAIVLAASLWGAQGIAIVKNLKGNVLIKQEGVYKSLEKGTYLQAGDILQTADNSSVGVVFNDGTVISLGPKSLFVVNRYRFKPSANEYDFDMTLSKGTVAVETGKIGKLAPQNVSFKVPQGSVGIRGTKFIIEVEE
ncbi:FecR family protein [Sulfuricurvum sp.]|uniref:FecR family protein n=1 Tax=Sulfuricurvum sp. TaxID=2025608 RepID=UPI003BB14405